MSFYHNSSSHELALVLMRHRENALNMIMLENEAAQVGNYDLTANIQKRSQDIIPSYSKTEHSTNEKCDDHECAECLYNVPEIIGTETVTIEVSENMTSCFETSATNVANDYLSRHVTNGAAPVREDLKLTCVVDKDAKDQNSCWSLFEGQQKLDESDQITSNTFEKKITLQQLFSLEEFGTCAQHMVPSTYGCINNHKQSIAEKKIEQVKLEGKWSMNLPFDASMTHESKNFSGDPSKVNLEKECSMDTNVPFDVTFGNQNGNDKENPPNDQVEGVCTSDFKSCAATVISGSEENRVSTDDQRLVNSHYRSVTEETIPDAAMVPAQSLFYSNNHGDLHFSGPYHVSESKVTSGHIAYSSSISLQSDSSTTSTRSFAFPTLQREWNTSPVRMAKADRRHMRKIRWRESIFCCKI